MLYLDHAATTPMRSGVWEAMAPYAADAFGNPSGSHGVSRRAKNALEEARERVAAHLGCTPAEVVFCGGGTEADNLAVKGPAVAAGRGGVVTVATEHEAVLESARFLRRLGHPVTIVGVDRFGRVDPDEVAAAVGPDTAVVSVMAANNETGTLQPVAEVAAAVKAANPKTVVHTDAVQAFMAGVDVDELGVDLLTLAAHKFGGPKGVGVLYVRRGVQIEPVLHGGGQEMGRRSGTVNVVGAVGMAAAMDAAAADRERFAADVAEARRRFEAALVGKAERTVPVDHTLVQHSHLRFAGVRNDTLLIRLDRRGVAAAAGSACQSGATTPSHVLVAMGYGPDEARECVRFTFGWTTRPEDGDVAAGIVLDALEANR